ncbi:uncharacterized protein LOC114579112 isoform X2 [Dendrobium catenatum]|uniref:uncharacterized protein LOC114579112 isoform X2 n=1 Tax=Dendrobium catenatum TaxID=906689 RepID=UPI0010A037B9|nr:uncharacterized protein LOC114579112 isoform X2 [Dendrobium catenatum]
MAKELDVQAVVSNVVIVTTSQFTPACPKVQLEIQSGQKIIMSYLASCYWKYVNGNFCNGNMLKEQWASLVAVLNRRIKTNYTDSSVMIRFKNMKVNFRTLYQLTNRSGWGWDEELQIPVATDELWDEIQQVNPKVARFRRHPFHQYEIFEKICAENIVVGSDARCTKMSEPVVNLNSEEDAPHIKEDFLAANGVS